jgi:hypothetical protein
MVFGNHLPQFFGGWCLQIFWTDILDRYFGAIGLQKNKFIFLFINIFSH